MKFSELVVLLPCHSLEDFPTHNEGTDAESLLSAWSALWHPALIVSAGGLPVWFRADAPPDNLQDRLLIIPGPSEPLLLAGWAARAKNEGAHVLRKIVRRDELIAAALAALDEGDRGVDPALAADFLALGTTYLLTELLTRQMRYMSNVDETHLKNETLAGATAALAGDGETARRHLKNCFDVLLEARERFYPVNAYLIDLTLVASTTIGASLRRQLAAPVPTNLVVSGRTIEELAQREPESLERLRLALDHRSAVLVGGEYEEGETPLESCEAIWSQLERGLAVYERHLGTRPTVYGRRRFGLSPVLPQLLVRSGFQGALHVTLDDGQFPQSQQAKTRWEGIDPSAIDALSRLPLDARSPETFLAFPRRLGETMDADHVATLVLVHWPDDAHVFYGDLQRMADYAPVLGKFITLNDYFAHTDRPGELTKFRADQYRSPYLMQNVIRKQTDPLGRFVERHREEAQGAHDAALDNVARQLLVAAGKDATAATDATVGERLTAALGAEPGRGSACLVVNGLTSPRRALVDCTPLETLPDVVEPVVAVQRQGSRRFALVDVPACGFVRLAAGTREPPPASRKEKPLAEERVLRNEFLEVHLHEHTGGIRALYTPDVRGNRLSQMLAFRLPTPRPKPGELWRDPDQDAQYSVMAVDGFEQVAAGPAWGEIVSRGRILDREGKTLAGYEQRYRLRRGARVLEMELSLDVQEPARTDPWNSYYAARFAWPEIDQDLWRGVALMSQPTRAKRIEAPEYIEIRQPNARTTLFTGGLPYHRFNGERMLDLLLHVRGETKRPLRLGIGVDVAHPAAEALELATNPLVAAPVAWPARLPERGWWFHVDAKNIVATSWRPLEIDGTIVGFRVRLLETEGRAGRVHLRCLSEPRSARQVDLLGGTLLDLSVEGDRVAVDAAAYEWLELEVRLR